MPAEGSPIRGLLWLAVLGGGAYWLLKKREGDKGSRRLTRPTAADDGVFRQISGEVDRALKARKLPPLKAAVADASGVTFTFGPGYHRKKNWDDEAVEAAMESVLASHGWFRKAMDDFQRGNTLSRFAIAGDAGGGSSRVVYGASAAKKKR